MAKIHRPEQSQLMTPGRLLAQQAGAPTPIQTTKNLYTQDSFANVTARLGIQQTGQNLISDSYYNLGPFITRNRLELEAMYRSSWLIGQLVDVIAEDMTKEGILLHSEMKPDDISKLQVAINEFSIWQDLCSTIKWSRLYGGAIAVILIDGANYEKELNIETVRKDQFKGLVVLDRWMIQPSMGELITDICKDIGRPKYYDIMAGVSTFPSAKIHYSRVLRFEGIELPYYQRLFENMWGLSVVERMLDRLIAYDSATQGAAQLLYRAYLRVIGVEGFREALANGGKDEEAVIKQFQYIRLMQNNEGITVLDAKDTFKVHEYSFAGINKLLDEFGYQISGATGIPLIRLFGQSPQGFSTGDTDIRNYYDRINKDQENKIRPHLDKLLAVMSKSVLGYDLPEDFGFEFKSLWQLSDTEKAQIASSDVDAMAGAFGQGLITKATVLKELKQQSDVTGRFTNITKEDIKDAEDEPPPDMFGGMEEFGGELPPEGGVSLEASPDGEDLEDEDPNDRLGGQNPEIPDEEGDKEPAEESAKGTGDSANEIFIREIKKSEYGNPSRSLPSIPDKEGYEKVYKPYGSQGKGFYYVARTKDSTKKIRFKDVLRRKLKKWLDSDFKEEEHPRAASGETSGQFVKKGEEVAKASGGEEKPKKTPPTELTIEDLSEEAKKKYDRITKLRKQFNAVWKENNAAVNKDDRAACMALIMSTGIRPGSNKDTKAKVKAYGATTLEGKHIIEESGNVFLRYIGKKGVDLNIPINDKDIARMLLDRKKKVGDVGRIFDTSHDRLLDYSHTLDGGIFKPKDFRTHVGTSTAMELVKKESLPSNFKEYKKKVMSIARGVAERLGNTAVVCLQAYIDPRVFNDWRKGVTE
uniref:Uncharacterized protein n=1 Tax=viral metagenome TaxID=1070528 RepID=A0A6M3M2H6_9ZZZZ